LLLGKLLSLRAEAIMVSEGPDAAWRQVQQGFEYAEVIYRSAGTVSQLAIARSIQGYFAGVVCAASAASEWPPATLTAIGGYGMTVQLGPLLIRSIKDEYVAALDTARAESADSPALLRWLLYQPNRTERMWSDTLGRAVAAASGGKYVAAYRFATDTPPVRERAPIFGRNWLGYKVSVPPIESCINSISHVANAELQMQLVRLAANIARYRAEVGAVPASLELLAKRFPDTRIADPWTEGTAPLRYDAERGIVYSLGPNRSDEHPQLAEDFETSPTWDDYGVRVSR
jgi:hypothetical protein